MAENGLRRTLAEILAERAAQRGDAPAVTFLGDGVNATHEIGFSALLVAAQRLASVLAAANVEPGERAVLFASDPIELLKAFLGCQLAGVIAVPVPAPPSGLGAAGIAPLRAVAAHCAARAIITEGEADRALMLAPAPELAALSWISTDANTEPLGEDELTVRRARNDFALLQYTSGSTGDPKGVVVPHEALLSNLDAHRRTGEEHLGDVFVEWVPLFHDMGLIGGALNSLNVGARAVLLAPELFIMRPLRWLEAITRYGGTIAHSPDFGFRHCAERIGPDDRAALDLSSWAVAVTAAEPVRARTLDEFSAAFEPHGFDPRAWFPAYGLAECTVMATAGVRRGQGATRAALDGDGLASGRVAEGNDAVLVGCGSPQATSSEIEIVDPVELVPVEAGQIGEIRIAGPSVCAGYWEAPAQTMATFGGVLAGEPETKYLRTGDLGFMADGELYVTGRLKEIIIIAGRNHYPHDVEATVASAHPAVSARHCVAFAVERDDAEQLIVVVGLRDSGADRGELARTVRAAVSAQHGIAVADLLIVPRGTISRTSSGKLRRSSLRAAYLAGELGGVGLAKTT